VTAHRTGVLETGVLDTNAVVLREHLQPDDLPAEPVRARQLELLAAEGVPARNGRVDLAAVGWPD